MTTLFVVVTLIITCGTTYCNAYCTSEVPFSSICYDYVDYSYTVPDNVTVQEFADKTNSEIETLDVKVQYCGPNNAIMRPLCAEQYIPCGSIPTQWMISQCEEYINDNNINSPIGSTDIDCCSDDEEINCCNSPYCIYYINYDVTRDNLCDAYYSVSDATTIMSSSLLTLLLMSAVVE